jgi:hypothetical protein
VRWPWPFSRRRSDGNVTAVPSTPRPAWAEVALPPPLAGVPAAPATPPVAEPEVQALLESLVGAHSGVHLGFADGSHVNLDASDPRSVALRAAADDLTAGEQRP